MNPYVIRHNEGLESKAGRNILSSVQDLARKYGRNLFLRRSHVDNGDASTST